MYNAFIFLLHFNMLLVHSDTCLMLAFTVYSKWWYQYLQTEQSCTLYVHEVSHPYPELPSGDPDNAGEIF